jgi:apolipoprotein N-acyltransferase
VTEWLAARHWGLRAAIAIVSGMVAALGFQPYAWWPLTPLGVAGLSLAVLGARRVRGATGLGFAWGTGFLLLGVGWMQVIFPQAMVALVLIEAVFYAVVGAMLKVASRSPWWPLLAAGCWSAVEFTYSHFPFNGFGWMRLGYAMVDSPLAWVLPLVGVAGLSFVTALVGQGVAWLAVAVSRRRLAVAGAVLAGIALLAAGGALVPVGAATGTVSVGYVQGGAPGGGVYGIGEARTTTRNHLAETERLAGRMDAGELPRPDFVVLPENTTDMDPHTDAETGRLVAAMSARLGVPMLFGAILDGPGTDERQTASLWWDPTRGELARYVKRGIVPFGEFIPFRSLLLPLIPELRFVGAQSIAGTEPGAVPVTLPDGRPLTLGVMVCYDLVYDNVVYDTVTHGGQVSIVQSSNAMYQGTGQIEQQFAITRARAMELRREILVVTTSGVSGLIDADGSVAFTAPEHDGASGVVTLTERSGLTPATWLASPLELALTTLTLLGLVACLWYGRMGRSGPRTGEENGRLGSVA